MGWQDDPIVGETPKTASPKEFADTYAPFIQKAADRIGVSPTVLTAQFGLETGWGKHIIPGTNNLGNIKDFSGRGIPATDSMTGSLDKYRAYDSPDQFAEDYARLIERRYPNALNSGGDAIKFASALKAGGYAEDPAYVQKIVAAHGQVSPKRSWKDDPIVDEPMPSFSDVKNGASKSNGISRAERLAKGLKDPLDAAAQLLYNAMPQSVQNAGDRLNNVIAESTGLTTKIPEANLSSIVSGKPTGFNAAISNDEKSYQERRANAGQSGLDAYRLAGNIASTLPVASLLPATAPTLAGRVALGVASGGIAGALQPVTEGSFLPEKAKQVAIAGAIGGAVPVVAQGVSKIISPAAAQNADLAALKAAGVRPTIGQALGGAANRIEEKAQSLPIMGDAITAARRQSIEDFNKATINRAVAPIGAKVSTSGTEGIEAASGAVSNAYTDALNKLGGVKFDGKFASDLTSLSSLAQNLTPDMAKKFTNELKSRVIGRMSPSGGMTAQTFKNVDSELGVLARDYGKSAVASEREFAGAIKELQSAIRSQAERVSSAYAEGVKPADAAFANLLRVQNAGKKAALQDGTFTPGQLMMAVRELDSSARKGATAKGQALMQDWAMKGQNVLGNKYPDSGTAGRLMYGAGALASGALNPLIPGALITGAGAYSTPAQRLAVLLASERPQGAKTVAQFVREMSPRLGAGAAMLNSPSGN
jgi:hypothetical protein